MHNELAWAVLGVETALQRQIEDAAASEGVSIGRWLELTLSRSRSGAAKQKEAAQQREQMCHMIVDMGETLVMAAKLLGVEPSTVRDQTQTLRPEAPSRVLPGPAASRREEDGPKVEDIKSWMRAMDEKKSEQLRSESKLSEFGRGLLRRSA